MKNKEIAEKLRALAEAGRDSTEESETVLCEMLDGMEAIAETLELSKDDNDNNTK